MLEATYVRPDRIMRTSVLEPTAEGYQPVRAAQGVATQFTEIYGPTIWGNHPRPANALGQPCVCPADNKSIVRTSKGDMQAVGAKTASTNEEAMASIARAFVLGQSIRMRDRQGRVVVAHPGMKTYHPFWSSIINRARALADKIIARRGRRGPLWQKPQQQIELRPPAPRPGAVPVTYGWAPQFNRPKRAARGILPSGARPPQSVYLPERAGARMEVPHGLTAEILAHRFPTGVPKMVAVRGQANALNWFHREGRYY